MKIHCTREQLLKVFSVVATVAPAKSPKEILANVKFVAEGDTLTLHATDMELWIIAPVKGVEVERPGVALLPTGRLGADAQGDARRHNCDRSRSDSDHSEGFAH